MKFKEQWIQEDIKCECCGQVTKQAKGLTKQNLKRLCFSKPTPQDWVMFVLWVSALIIAFSYNTEIAECQNVITNFDTLCINYMSQPILGNTPGKLDNNLLGTLKINSSVYKP